MYVGSRVFMCLVHVNVEWVKSSTFFVGSLESKCKCYVARNFLCYCQPHRRLYFVNKENNKWGRLSVSLHLHEKCMFVYANNGF